jgi:hypothetical protein
MNRRSEYFEIIDKYLNNEVIEPELSELEVELKLNFDLSEEYNLQLDIQKAIQEQDIIALRENLNKTIHNQVITTNGKESSFPDSFNFGLAEELTSSHNFNGKLNIEEVINFTHTFPKIHLYQHIVAAKENIYQFYKEQYEHDSLNEEESHSQIEDALFEDIKSALKETDLLDLRANLKQIAGTIPDHSYSIEEINNYVYGQMDSELKIRFEEELKFNTNLAKDVQLIYEIDLASSENDIMNLRATLNEIQKSELKTYFNIEEIEGYIHNELTDDEMALFEEELSNNKKLYSEIELIKNIDKAIQENDIIQLRNNLGNIAVGNLKEKLSERSISVRFKPLRYTKSIAAASLILLLGITGLISRYSSEDNIYQKFYTKYETTGISRSSNDMNDQTLSIALQKFNDKDYESALNLLQEVISRDQNNTVGHFYTGVSLQELGRYTNAIKEYEVVVTEKDNLFIEQAEWYIGLCYIQTKENKKAIKQFKKIANSQGFYQQKAVAVLRKMKSNI